MQLKLKYLRIQTRSSVIRTWLASLAGSTIWYFRELRNFISPGQWQHRYMMVWQWKTPTHKFHALLMVVLPVQNYRTWTVNTNSYSKWQVACVTFVDVCKGSLHIYRTVGELRAPEGLLKLDHTPYGRLTSQGSSSPILTLGSSSC